MKKITLPLNEKIIQDLKAGDTVLLSGILYSARDAAHKQTIIDLDETGILPFNINNETIFYMGPCPAKPGEIIGPAGPTTSHRMDKYTPQLLNMGLKGMIGKGNRSQSVIDSIIENKAVYFSCVGGTGALCAQCIKSVEVIAYDFLGTEAIRKLVVEDFPVIVVIDSFGNNLFETERKKYMNMYKKEKN